MAEEFFRDPKYTAEEIRAHQRRMAEGGPNGGDYYPIFTARPFVWRDPVTIAPRRFIYGRQLIAGYVSCTIAAGGVGKTCLIIADALALVTGRTLLADAPYGKLKVWIINLEDPRDEIERRIAAAMLHYGISADEVKGRLFVNSGRDNPLILARQTREGLEFDERLIAIIKAEIRTHGIHVVFIDPMVLAHAVSENDNVSMAALMRRITEIAEETGPAIDLVHHARKAQSGQTEIGAEDGRGAISTISAARSVRVINVMSEKDADKAGIDHAKRFSFLRIDNGKRNLAPPPDGATWCRLVSVDLNNGVEAYPSDSVGVCAPWQWPDALEGLTAAKLFDVQRAIDGRNYRQNVQANDWVGIAIGKVLGLDPTDKSDRHRINAALKLWLCSGALTIGTVKDPKGIDRPIVEVGEWAI